MRNMQIAISLLVLVALDCSGSQDGTTINISGPAKITTCTPGLKAEQTNGVDCDSYCNYRKTDKKIDCPEEEGFFRLPSSNQCFKAFTDNRNEQWHEAQHICDEAGLVLAEPEDDIVPELQLYLNSTVDFEYLWVNGRGTGSSIRWQRRLPERPKRGPEVDLASNLWYPGHPGKDSVTIEHCLALDASGRDVIDFDFSADRVIFVDHIGQPYKSEKCWYTNVPLCERIME